MKRADRSDASKQDRSLACLIVIDDEEPATQDESETFLPSSFAFRLST